MDSSNSLRLQESNTKLIGSTKLLEHAQQKLCDIENIGSEIVTNLSTQRETLERTHKNISQTENNTNRAKRLLRNMTHNEKCRTHIAILLILILITIIALIIYFNYK